MADGKDSKGNTKDDFVKENEAARARQKARDDKVVSAKALKDLKNGKGAGK